MPERAAADLPESQRLNRRLRTGTRIWRMLISATIGWLVGFAISLPIQLRELVETSAGDEQLLLDSLSHALLVWGIITAGIGAAATVIALGPFAAMVNARWVVRHRLIVTGAPPAILFAVFGYRAILWLTFKPGPYSFRGPLYLDYTLFSIAFSLVSLGLYHRLLRRGSGGVDASSHSG